MFKSVKIGKAMSEQISLESGVPQGGILSPKSPSSCCECRPGGNEQSGCVIVNIWIQSMLSLKMIVCKSKNILNGLDYIQS